MGFEVNNPFLYQLREGSVADPFVDKVESLRVVDGRLLLSEMPVKQNGVLVDGHTEIDTNSPTGTQFYVDYTNGTVYFVSTKNTTVTARYKGRGLVQIPSERIYHKKGSVTRTLDTIVETVDTSAIAASNAASLANAKATAADSAATAANTQSTYAKAQGDYAKAQGDYATTAVTNANTATNTANNATNAASTATTQANTARDAANTAAANANAKATLAEQKAAAVDAVATKADTNANFATTQGTYAKEQGDYAKAQGLVAKDQGDYAKFQGDRVDTRLSQTNTAEQNAITATTNAVAATQGVLNSIAQVTNQGTLAGQAAAQATSQADYAKAQGDYAKAQGDAAKAAVVGTITNKAVTSAKLDDDVQVGSLKALKTDVKTSVTGALNEIFEDVTKSVLGSKLTSTTLANFVGKVSGSTTANPHMVRQTVFSSLRDPSNAGSELPDSLLPKLTQLDGTVHSYSNSTSGMIVMQTFSFNLIEQIQRQYGITLSGTTADKVAWLKANLSKLTFNWHGYGSSATGNKASVQRWNSSASQWYSPLTNTAITPSKITISGNTLDIALNIDASGLVHFLAYAEPSDGVTPSIINTDYAELLVELKTDILSSLPVATTTTPGVMSPADKVVLDNGQKFKLTADNGFSKYNAAQDDADLLLAPGNYACYSGTKNVPESGGHIFVIQKDGSQAAQIFIGITSNIYVRSYATSWRTWRKLNDTSVLGSILLGNKLVDQSNANFVGKIEASNTANPHYAGRRGFTSLETPFGTWVEMTSSDSNTGYPSINSMDGRLNVQSTSTSGVFPQHRFSFNLIEHVQRTYGAIPGATTADKVAWLKSNLSKLTFNWFGFGSSPAGNKATVAMWSNPSNVWYGQLSSGLGTVTKLPRPAATPADINAVIDSNGFVHFLAYAEASDGTTASVINTDYVELNVELSTDLWSSAKPQWVNATLQNSWVEFDTTQTPKYELGKDGFVELIGAVKSGTLGSAMMTLPTGYRPIKQFTGLLSGNDGNIYRIAISTAGIVTVTQSVGSGGNAFVSLDGIRFPVA